MQTHDYILAGATGLVGTEILKQLAHESNAGQIICLGRTAPPHLPPRGKFIAHDFKAHVDWQKLKLNAPVAICTLGTTIKKAGSQEEFRRVDYDYVLNFAEETKRIGAIALHVVTAHGASSHSSIFHNRVKGEIEEKLKSLALPSLHIYRPSLLLGERHEKRFSEGAATWAVKFLAPLFKLPGLNAVQPTPVSHLARYILHSAQNSATGNHVHSNSQMMSTTELNFEGG
ncbi:MAG TPA: hypothetical protein PLY93_04145 [Turneriella sp.]|nr:hypothetical protein [Turneriella sp.]